MPLDDTPITITLSTKQIGYTLSAIRAMIKKRERDSAKKNFVPSDGKIDVTLMKLKNLREAEDIMQATLRGVLAKARGDELEAGT